MPSFSSLRDLTAGVRGWLYSLLAPVQVLVVTLGLVTDTEAALWAPAVAALLGFTVAGQHVTSTWREWLYRILLVTAPLAVAIGGLTDSQAGAIVAVVSTALGLGVAAYHTPRAA